jgi:maltooligosyltrehalose synthase
MPVVASPSYHGYDTTDYYTIEDDYGTAEDFGRSLRRRMRGDAGDCGLDAEPHLR